MKLVIPLALVAVAACVTARVEPVSLHTPPPPGPWAVMRDVLVRCALDYGLTGELRTRVAFDRGGLPLSVASEYGDGYASCVGNSIQRTRFRQHRERAYEIAFRAP